MPDYTKEDTLRLAKRFQNSKRPYLLVNPLQAKHIPVSPSAALTMMGALGELLAKQYPGARLVLGFAETATAVGAAVAASLGPECVYLHTTRENFPQAGQWLEFLEEHSHAVEQKLPGDRLPEWLAATDTVILVDDEISTGKTLRNMVAELEGRYPQLRDKQIVAASILNRVSPENQQLLEEAGIHSQYLVKLPQEDYAALVEDLEVAEAPPAEPVAEVFHSEVLACGKLLDPRLGLLIGAYEDSCAGLARAFLTGPGLDIPAGSRVAVLGTEECMYPALTLGAMLEERGCAVRCHATTRSPIGVCGRGDYPIRSGAKLPSFYDEARPTYLYNMDGYDAIVVVSDTPVEGTGALASLLGAFPPQAGRKVFYVQGGRHVWYL